MDDSGEPTDREIMARIADPERIPALRAFDILFQRHRRSVYAFAFRMTDGNRAAAEDITQECFLRLWRARFSYRPGTATLRTYLFTITRRLVLDSRKRREVETVSWERETNGAEIVAKDLPLSGSPERALLTQELAQVLDRALGCLAPDLREVVLLRDTEGLTYEEIATILGCPVGTVRSRLNAARTRLRAVTLAYWNDSEKLP